MQGINQTLAEKKQVMLFLNRRGASTFVVCRDCGYVAMCPNCEIPLTFHLDSLKQALSCHHCDYKASPPVTCPVCESWAIKYFGLGTQRVELELKKAFPQARIARMDRDTTKKRGSHEEIYQGFAKKDFDILIGTQMIAKGWDLPDVAFVGVISADTMLNIPDFRSAERTFALLTQIAGRTGRGFHPGKVLVQTYNPDHYAIKHAAKHDYIGFYEQEIVEREKFLYPPFKSFIKLTYSAGTVEKAETECKDLYHEIKKLGIEGLEVSPPFPAYFAKLAGKYRWQLILKAEEAKIQKVQKEIGKLFKQGWTIDVNPDNLL